MSASAPPQGARRLLVLRCDRLDRLVPDTGDDEAGGDDRRHLRAEAEAASDRDPARGSSAEERAGEGGRERDAAEVPEGGALGALAALERCAVLALAEVGAEGASLGARELVLLEARQGHLGLLARETAFELLAKGAASAEDQGLDGADRGVENLGDLRVGASFELAHDECGALVESEEAERAADLGAGRDVGVFGGRGGERLVELDLLGAARGVAEALAADVVRDLDQPVVRLVRALAALEGAVGAEERLLRDVFGVGLVVEDREGVAVDRVDVLRVHPLEGAVSSSRSLREDGGHCLVRRSLRHFLAVCSGHGSCRTGDAQ